jgi:hypothetical protein
MGHKGVSKRKLPKPKLKTPATANRGTGAVSGLARSEGTGGQLPEKAKAMPLGGGRMNPSSGSKKGHKNH